MPRRPNELPHPLRDAATARPWRKSDRVPERHAIRIINSRGALVAEARAAGGSWKDAERHAALIVRAVNSFEAMRDALQDAREQVNEWCVGDAPDLGQLSDLRTQIDTVLTRI